jgi:hypothetical protein
MTAVQKLQSLDELLVQRDQILQRHARELQGIEAEIAQAMRARGMAYTLLGTKRQPGMASAKQSFHDRNREECIKRGWVKPDGTADLERFRLEKKAESLGISIIEVAKREAAEKAKRAEARFKTVGKTGKR